MSVDDFMGGGFLDGAEDDVSNLVLTIVSYLIPNSP